jgi:hypothetical protein
MALDANLWCLMSCQGIGGEATNASPCVHVGGDPSAGSPTDTLLRLSPPCRISVRKPQSEISLLRPYSGGLTGGVCKEQGHIHRLMLTSDYYGIQLHEGELQPSIRTTIGFRDWLHLSMSQPIVPTFVARV